MGKPKPKTTPVEIAETAETAESVTTNPVTARKRPRRIRDAIEVGESNEPSKQVVPFEILDSGEQVGTKRFLLSLEEGLTDADANIREANKRFRKAGGSGYLDREVIETALRRWERPSSKKPKLGKATTTVAPKNESQENELPKTESENGSENESASEREESLSPSASESASENESLAAETLAPTSEVSFGEINKQIASLVTNYAKKTTRKLTNELATTKEELATTKEKLRQVAKERDNLKTKVDRVGEDLEASVAKTIQMFLHPTSLPSNEVHEEKI